MLQQHCQKTIPWDNPLVNALLLAVRGAGPHQDDHRHPEKKLKQLFSSSHITYVTTTWLKSHSLGQPLGKCPTPGCRRCWTSPRWSWTSRNNFKQLFSSSPITSVKTTLSKYQSLGHSLVVPYSWLSEVLDLTQMVMDIQKQLKKTFVIIP